MSNKTIGPKIEKIRKQNGLTQEEFAKSLGYSGRSVISHIEKGDADMTYEKILLLLKTYALDANELFEVQKIDKLLDDYKKIPRHSKVVIYIHGMHGSAKEVEDFVKLPHYDVIGIDYPNGQPWDVGEAVKKEFETVIKPYDEVVVVANSIGCLYTYECLSSFNIKQAFFISPVASMFEIINGMMKMNHISLEELKEKKYIQIAGGVLLSYDYYMYFSNYKDNWKVPTEILYGSEDKLISLKSVTDFLAVHPNASLTIKEGAKHHFHTKEEIEFVQSWIANKIR